MRNKLVFVLMLVTLMLSVARLGAATPNFTRAYNTQPTYKYMDTLVLAQLKLTVDKDTDMVHFIKDNADPYVVTKTYLLKYADPYEIRPYLRNVTDARRVQENETTVECIKYNNGEAIMIVSAEEYRFTDHEHGMGIDTIVKMLDKPHITSSSGQTRYIYFPKFRNAIQLQEMIRNVGANIKGDVLELTQGKDKVEYDADLNCVFFYVPRYSKKNIQTMLKYYDIPLPECNVSYKVYELYAENDSDIGADFLAWKNNAGADLFSVGGRYRNNWSAMYNGPINKSGSSKTEFINFNPKWNSRYLDFLASKGKAKIVTSGQIAVKNNATGIISKETNMYNVERGEQIADREFSSYIALTKKDFTNAGASAAVKGYYKVTGYDTAGNAITLNNAVDDIDFTAYRALSNGGRYSYFIDFKNLPDGTYLVKKGGQNLGSSTGCCGLTVQKCVEYENDVGNIAYKYEDVSWTDSDMTIYKNTQFALKDESGGYGFNIQITPSVCSDATTLEISMQNSSLIGWDSDGKPRIARDSTVNTKIMISNHGHRFVVGGLAKRSVVRSVTGVPFLRHIPFLGYLFSTESESVKHSQLVFVAECRSNYPDTSAIKEGVLGDILKISTDSNKKNIDYGFEQLELDKNMTVDKIQVP